MRSNCRVGKFYIRIPFTGLTQNEVRKFNEEFITRYSGRLSKGEDLRFVWEFELSCLETGLKYFKLDTEYTNLLGMTVTVRQRREDFLIVEYEGDMYEADFGHDGESEFLVLSDAIWRADFTPEEDTTENEYNGER